MGDIQQVRPAKLFIALTYHHEEYYTKIRSILIERFGRIDLAYSYPFSQFTKYYQQEMGNPLSKTILSFEAPIHKERSSELKHYSNELELEFSDRSDYPPKRKINIDPGYLTEAKVVLLTTKNFSHRIYIGKGIFAEITLTYRKTSFTPNSWTYPDYQSPGVIEFFNEVREYYRNQLYQL